LEQTKKDADIKAAQMADEAAFSAFFYDHGTFKSWQKLKLKSGFNFTECV